MFNSKLKQRIAVLEAANQQLQNQYNLVHELLLQRQDQVVALQRELATIQPATEGIDYLTIKEIAGESLRLAIEEKLHFLTEATTDELSDFFTESLAEGLDNLANSDSDSDSDSDEDEDEYYDSDFTDPNEDDED